MLAYLASRMEAVSYQYPHRNKSTISIIFPLLNGSDDIVCVSIPLQLAWSFLLLERFLNLDSSRNLPLCYACHV